jgi:hypothetical protein
MYYKYFRERASLCRRSAEGTNAWLSEVSLELAVMFEEMAEDALIRELSRRSEATAVAAGLKAQRPMQPDAATLQSRASPWWRIGCDRPRERRPVHPTSAIECI